MALHVRWRYLLWGLVSFLQYNNDYVFVKEDCLVHESKYGCITCKLFVYQSGHVANCGNKLIFYAKFCFRKEHFKHSVSKLPVCHWMVVVFNSDIVFRLLYRLYQSLHGLFLDGVSLPHVNDVVFQTYCFCFWFKRKRW